MRWKNTFIPTLRDEPSGVQAASHRLLVRAGYIQQVIAGVYSLLPLAQRVRLKVVDLIRKQMNEIGAQEFFLAALQPMELWQESGRADAVSDVMFRLKDRKGAEIALGLTHEEVFTSIARTTLSSYKQLPQMWYQIQTKFRDEARPKGGLLRVREFTMKDSYSFDIDEQGLDRSFHSHRDAYCRIFELCGLKYLAVDASSGAMGGSASTEFMIFCSSGEDSVVSCGSCGYAANVEKAESAWTPASDEQNGRSLEKFATPDVRTIKQLEEFGEGYPATRQIKTLVYVADSKLVIALVQGDQELNEAKLQSSLQAAQLRQATEQEIVAALGASPGSLGACAVKSGGTNAISKIVADNRLQARCNMVTGANEDGFHFRHVDVARDIVVDAFVDLHSVKSSDRCAKCSGEIEISNALEIGHIFKLGTRYTEIMNGTILHADGSRTAMFMGSYGIGVERLMAAIVEQNHDEFGICWPVAVAPFAVCIVPINMQNSELAAAAEKIYQDLLAAGVDVLIDDRDERAGVKFNDADLIGIPLRITVGKKVADGLVELRNRQDKSVRDVSMSEIAKVVVTEISRSCGKPGA